MLLSITNRLGRTIDRSRILVLELDAGSASVVQKDHKRQLSILLRRSRYLRAAVLCISVSIFLSALMILSIFFQAFEGWNVEVAVLSSLFLGVSSLCAAVVFLFFDVSAGLRAMEVEVGRHI